MLSSLTQNWWAVALRGLAAVILGAVVIANPGATLTLLIPFLGFFALFAGVMTIISGFAAIGAHGTWWVTRGHERSGMRLDRFADAGSNRPDLFTDSCPW